MRAAEGVGPYKGMRIGKPLRLAMLGTSPFRGGKRGDAALGTSPLHAFG